jgi:uncharacterized membrane protein
MTTLLAGLVLFFGVHLVPTFPGLREQWRGGLGAIGYQIAFSVLSLIGLYLIVRGYGTMRSMPGNIELWSSPRWTRHVAYLLMLPAMILLVASNVPSRIRTAAKHPMLAATKIWALAHLIANGDLASVLLFGTFLAYGVYDRISVGKRNALGPLGSRAGAPVNDVVVVVIGVALFALIVFWAHGALFGVPLYGG